MNSISSEIPQMMVPLSSAPIDLMPLLNAEYNNTKVKKSKSKSKNANSQQQPKAMNQSRNPSLKSESSSTFEIKDNFKQFNSIDIQRQVPQMNEAQKKSFQNCHTVYCAPSHKSSAKEQKFDNKQPNFQKRDNQNHNSRIKVRFIFIRPFKRINVNMYPN